MTAPAPADDRLRVVVDIRTSETVFGPATVAQTADWIIRDGFWRGADLAVKVLPERQRTITCWADPLNREERRTLAAALASACKRSWDAATAQRTCVGWPALVHTSAEMSRLHLDVTERAEVAR